MRAGADIGCKIGRAKWRFLQRKLYLCNPITSLPVDKNDFHASTIET